MAKWNFEIDTTVYDQDVLKEYQQLESKIESFIKSHPERNRTDEDREYLSNLVRQRPGIMRRLGKMKFKDGER